MNRAVGKEGPIGDPRDRRPAGTRPGMATPALSLTALLVPALAVGLLSGQLDMDPHSVDLDEVFRQTKNGRVAHLRPRQ